MESFLWFSPELYAGFILILFIYLSFCDSKAMFMLFQWKMKIYYFLWLPYGVIVILILWEASHSWCVMAFWLCLMSFYILENFASSIVCDHLLKSPTVRCLEPLLGLYVNLILFCARTLLVALFVHCDLRQFSG